MMARIG